MQADYTEHIYQEYHYKGYEPIHQLEEIVRCKVCKYFYCICVDGCVCTRNKEKLMFWVEPDGFCKWGEKK